MKIKFEKMQTLGNDFVLLDLRQTQSGKSAQTDAVYDAFPDMRTLAPRLCHRRTGIGADGVLTLESSPVADAKMRIFNADGSEAELCGNGLRCVVKKIADAPESKKSAFSVQTACGIKRARVTRVGGTVKNVCVETGKANFAPSSVPTAPGAPTAPTPTNQTASNACTEVCATFGKKRFTVTCLSVGNPHCVVFCKDCLDEFDENAAAISQSPFFPRGTNVEFVRFDSTKKLTMRVFERGCGETASCGTGACAVVAAAVATGRAAENSWIEVHTKGGCLLVKQRKGVLYLSGDASYVFTGEIRL